MDCSCEGESAQTNVFAAKVARWKNARNCVSHKNNVITSLSATACSMASIKQVRVKIPPTRSDYHQCFFICIVFLLALVVSDIDMDCVYYGLCVCVRWCRTLFLGEGQ